MKTQNKDGPIEMSTTTHQNAPSWLHLSSEEQVLWFGRPHWLTVVPPVAVGLLMALLGIAGTIFLAQNGIGGADTSAPGWVTFLPLILTIIGLVGGIWGVLKWRFIGYVITSGEIYEKRGVISQNTEHIRIRRIQNTTCEQSIIERILSFGDVVIYTAGSGSHDMVFGNVPHPKRVDQKLAVQYDKIHKESKQEEQRTESM